ncbi:MAG: response regulator [Candidatus Hodarchaeota archaeon]
MALVMLIDDDKEPMMYYIMALKQGGFDVQQINDPDEAMEYICNQSNRRPDIIILDIMLPPGKRYEGNPACDNGLRTGILLYSELKEHYSNVPFLVLTNLRKAAKDFKRIAPDVPVLQKIDTPPFDLVNRIRRIIEKK